MGNKILKVGCFGVIWSAVALLIATVLQKNIAFNFKDIMFVEGMLMVVIATLASISGNSLGISLQGLGNNNAQYMANANLEITKREKELTKSIVKSNVKFGVSSICLLIGGIITLLLNFAL